MLWWGTNVSCLGQPLNHGAIFSCVCNEDDCGIFFSKMWICIQSTALGTQGFLTGASHKGDVSQVICTHACSRGCRVADQRVLTLGWVLGVMRTLVRECAERIWLSKWAKRCISNGKLGCVLYMFTSDLCESAKAQQDWTCSDLACPVE